MKIRIINKIIALFLLTSFSTLATGQTTDTTDQPISHNLLFVSRIGSLPRLFSRAKKTHATL